MTTVKVSTHTYSVTYVADKILNSFKEIILQSGLDPSGMVGDWKTLTRGIETWLGSRHLNRVVLEIFNPSNDDLVKRWDIDVVYGPSGDGEFWTDPEQIKYHIRKAGLAPEDAAYNIVVENSPGHPEVAGWVSTSFRSTQGFVRHVLGTTISHSGLSGSAAYWRREG